VLLEQAKPEFIKERKHIEIFERRYIDGVLCLGTNDRHHHLADRTGERRLQIGRAARLDELSRRAGHRPNARR